MKFGFELKLGVGIVVVFGLLIAGVYTWPRISEKMCSEQWVLLFAENFDNGTWESANLAHYPPGAAWPAYFDKRSTDFNLKMKKKYGRCFLSGYGGGAAYEKLEFPPPIRIEFDLRVESISGYSHLKDIGAVFLSKCSDKNGFIHYGDNFRLISLARMDAKSFNISVIDRTLKCGQWYHVRLDYSHRGNRYITEIRIDGVQTSERTGVLGKWQKDWNKIVIGFGGGYGNPCTAMIIDNVRVYTKNNRGN